MVRFISKTGLFHTTMSSVTVGLSEIPRSMGRHKESVVKGRNDNDEEACTHVDEDVWKKSTQNIRHGKLMILR